MLFYVSHQQQANFIAETTTIRGKPADIWALGVTLFCLVHGRCPFEDEDEICVYAKIQNDKPKTNKALSGPLRHLFKQLLHKNEQKRITLDRIKKHYWVTENKTRPMTSTDDNCPEEETDDIETVFKPAKLVYQVHPRFLQFRL